MGDLSIQNLVVEYSSGGYAVRPLDGFSLDVAAGSLVILLGPSGCGKTTLLSCLGGILKPTAGAIKFGDVDVTALDAKGLSKYRRETVGIVFQAFNLVPSLTALENVMVPLRAAGMPRPAAREKARELLARVGLADRATHRSSGEIELVRELAGGGEELVWVAEPGEYFGELGPLFHMPRSATARARSDATVISYTVAAFRERLGAGGIRDLIEHRPLDIADEPATQGSD